MNPSTNPAFMSALNAVVQAIRDIRQEPDYKSVLGSARDVREAMLRLREFPEAGYVRGKVAPRVAETGIDERLALGQCLARAFKGLESAGGYSGTALMSVAVCLIALADSEDEHADPLPVIAQGRFQTLEVDSDE